MWFDDFRHVLRENEPLAPHCWLGIGGAAEFFAEPTSVEELSGIVSRCAQDRRPLRVLGAGSNLLINDHGVPGVVLELSAPAFCGIQVDGSCITAGGGASLAHLISTSAREGLGGLDPLVGIPGTVGGALARNAGDRTTDVATYLVEAEIMTHQGEILVRRKQELQFAYRESGLGDLVVLRARFALEPEDRQELLRRMQTSWIVRRSREPTRDKRTACLFKDPQGTTASELIEQAGLRGTRVGSAALYDRDVNFVVVSADGWHEDVLKLMDLVRDRVNTRMGIALEQALQAW